MNWKHVLGTVTIVTIVGGTIYAIKKSYDAKKEAETAISLEEAKAIVKSAKELEAKREEQMAENAEDFEEMIEDMKDVASYNRSFMKDEEPSIVVKTKQQYEEELDQDFNEEEEEKFSTLADEDFMYIGEHNINPKEDLELRFEPNSVEAKHQYIRMELADWNPTDFAYRTLLKLFDFPFKPQNDGDEILRTQIIDFKVQFFGFGSRWVKDITIADIILHYARAAEFNCGESVRYWVEYFFDFNGFHDELTSQQIDHLLKYHNSHSFFNEETQTFGLFGLTRESMDQAIAIAGRNVDNSVTYEIEFNEFLKSAI